MRKGIVIVSTILMLTLILSGCSSAPKITKEENPKVAEEAKPSLPLIKNLDSEERILIKSQNIRSIDKIQFVYNSRGKLTNGQKNSQLTYDTAGFITSTLFYNKDGKVDQKYEYRYDNKGIRTETIRLDSKGKADKQYAYEYNNYGNKTKASRLSNSGKLEKYYIYNYDDNGNLTDELWYDAAGNMEFKIVNHYSPDGNKVESLNYNATGDLISRSIYKYDKNNNVIEEDRFDDDNNPSSIIQYVYKYY
ncbi:MAG: hypothetical protein WCA84_10975 [Ignavibacteriaceae bacterium]